MYNMCDTSAMLYTAPGSNNHPLPNDTGWLLGTGQVLSPGAVYNTAASPVLYGVSLERKLAGMSHRTITVLLFSQNSVKLELE